MKAEGLSTAAIDAFKYNFKKLTSGDSLFLGEAEISPVRTRELTSDPSPTHPPPRRPHLKPDPHPLPPRPASPSSPLFLSEGEISPAEISPVRSVTWLPPGCHPIPHPIAT
eukprot:6460431-Prymnesium_polylepis.1